MKKLFLLLSFLSGNYCVFYGMNIIIQRNITSPSSGMLSQIQKPLDFSYIKEATKKLQQGPINILIFSSCGSFFVTGSMKSGKGVVTLYNSETYEVIKTFSFDSKIYALTLSPDNSFIAIGLNRSRVIFISLFSQSTHTLMHKPTLLNQHVVALHFISNQRMLLVLLNNGTIALWKYNLIKENNNQGFLPICFLHMEYASPLNKDQFYFYSNYSFFCLGSEIIFFESATQASILSSNYPRRIIFDRGCGITGCLFSPDRRYFIFHSFLVGGVLFNTITNERTLLYQNTFSPTEKLFAYSDNSSLVAVAMNRKNINIYSCDKGTLLATIFHPNITTLNFLPNSQKVLCTDTNGDMHIWNPIISI